MIRKISAAWMLWVIVVTVLHVCLNLSVRAAGGGETVGRKLKLGYLPVTCHLTCPVTDYITRANGGVGMFEPVRFSGFPELKETFLSRRIQATFILAPMAMALREQGVPIKIVYLGHRDGTALVVNKSSKIFRIEDLVHKRIAVPNRFSNQRLLLFKAFQDRGLNVEDVTLVEIPPPDMPAALYAGAVDAITSGEPYMGQTELDGYGRVLYLTKDVWPGFISCVLAVHEDLLHTDRAAVLQLIEGIARSGKWLEGGMQHRMEAAQFVSTRYYNQHPRLLSFVLSKPPDRVTYSNLALHRQDFEEIERLGQRAGILRGTAHFEDYTEAGLVNAESLKPWPWSN